MEKKYKENKFVLFMKKNIYLILMVLCLFAIAGLVTYTVVSSNVEEPGPIVDANNKPIEDEGNETPNDSPVVNVPDGSGGQEEPEEMVFDMPIVGAAVLKDYVDTELVYNATMKHWSTHQGIDYKAEVGTAVRCVFDGEVSAITTTTMHGTTVTVKHSKGFSTSYALLGSNVAVKVGDKVSKGTVLGYVAETGYFESADGPHLHFEARKDNVLIDPNYYFAGNENK